MLPSSLGARNIPLAPAPTILQVWDKALAHHIEPHRHIRALHSANSNYGKMHMLEIELIQCMQSNTAEARLSVDIATRRLCLHIAEAAAAKQQSVMAFCIVGAARPSIRQLLDLARCLASIALADQSMPKYLCYRVISQAVFKHSWSQILAKITEMQALTQLADQSCASCPFFEEGKDFKVHTIFGYISSAPPCIQLDTS